MNKHQPFPKYLLAAILFLMIVYACKDQSANLANRPSGTGSESSSEWTHRSAASDEVVRHYTWQDINRTRNIKERGNVDGQTTTEKCQLTAKINKTRLKNVVESYGIPESWMHYTYTSEQDRRRKIDEMRCRIAIRGLTYFEEGNTINADYKWIVENSVSDMRDTAISLKDEAVRLGYEDARQLDGLIASFVQSLEYRIPPTTRYNGDGKKVHIGGLTMPLETLYNGYGDCDTKSVMFASIMKNYKGAGMIFLKGEKHIFVGIRMEPRMYEKYVVINGEKYVLVELTYPHPLGKISQNYLHALRLKKMAVVPIF